jgi:uncharacterized protein
MERPSPLIIDCHTHVGNILKLLGGKQVHDEMIRAFNLMEEDAPWYKIFDYGYWRALKQYRPKQELGVIGSYIRDQWMIRSEHRRVRAATFKNLADVMAANGVGYACVLPVPPNVLLDDIKGENYPNILRFGSVDFDSETRIEEAIEDALSKGARGLKLHPILQRIRLTDPRVLIAVEKFGKSRYPVMLHVGENSYYHGTNPDREMPGLGGNIDDVEDLVKKFPNVNFIIGHAGLGQVDQVIKKLSRYSNVYVDVSFQSPEGIMILIEKFGPKRVLFGSDWPFGDIRTMIKNVEEACGRDEENKILIFSRNTADLVGLELPQAEAA